MESRSNSVLIIGFVWPEPNTTAAGNRMLQLILFFLEQKYKITFASTATPSEYSVDLDALGIRSQSIVLNKASFNDFVADLNPDIVLFDRFLTEEQFGWRVAESAPNALRILDTEDLHSLRTVRENCVKSQNAFTNEQWLQNDLTKREMASIYRCDLSLIISSHEMQLLTEVIKIDGNLLIHLPFLLRELTTTERHNWITFSDREHFICIGNGKHAPNIDAIKWLKTGIWPLIRKSLPKTELHIYGAYLPAQIKQLHKPLEGFLVKGWAKDVHEVMGKRRVNLAPLRFGAGLKGKLIDAMLSGTPSVTTEIGVEGMQGKLSWSGSIEDAPQAFAEAAIELYQNEAKWKTAQSNGTVIINSLYKKEQLSKTLIDRITRIQSDLQHHRTLNFIGAMLMHQTMASTKYMSKWIEIKHSDIQGDKDNPSHIPT